MTECVLCRVGCQRLFFRQIERDPQRSRFSEARSAEKKEITSGHTYPEPYFRAVNRITYPTKPVLPAARHSICLFSFLTFRLSMFVRGAAIREIAHTKWKKITSTVVAHQSTISVGFST